MSKNINEEKYQSYQKKRIFKYGIIGLSIVIIVLEILALLNKISMIWGLLLFIVLYIFKKKYQSN